MCLECARGNGHPARWSLRHCAEYISGRGGTKAKPHAPGLAREGASKHRFIVYGVPEGFRDEAFRVICKQWNQQVRDVCIEVGPRVEFVSTVHVAHSGTQCLSYHPTTSKDLGQQLGRRMCTFLGLRQTAPPQQLQGLSQPPMASLIAALGQAFLQMAGSRPQKKRRHSQGVSR